MKLSRRRSRDQFEALRRRLRHLRDVVQSGRHKNALHFRPHSRQPFYLERREKFPLHPRGHLEEIVRLAQLRRHGSDQFIRAQSLRNGDAQMIANILAQPFGRGARTPFGHSRKISVAFVDRPDFHVRCVVVDQREHHPRKVLILFVIPRQHDEVRANLKRPRRRHRRVNPEPPRFVTGRGDDPALHPPDRYRLAAQPRFGRHLAPDKKRIRIQMHRRALFRPLHTADLPYPPYTVQMFSIIPTWPIPPRSHRGLL